MPEDMLARMLLALGLVIGLLYLFAYAIKRWGARIGLPVLPQRGTPRLQLLEMAAMDARHRLVLVRRDDKEHLLLMGGAQPVVIETGIQPKNTPQPDKEISK